MRWGLDNFRSLISEMGQKSVKIRWDLGWTGTICLIPVVTIKLSLPYNVDLVLPACSQLIIFLKRSKKYNFVCDISYNNVKKF